MNWFDLAFLHWRVPATLLRPWVPRGLKLDTFEGEAWLGVVPFAMRGVRPRCVPPLPRMSAFLELNLRTYVVADGQPGVWFFSLDAANRLAVRVARAWYHLPYYDARMQLTHRGDTCVYESARTHRAAPSLEYRGHYEPTGQVYTTQPGQIDHWLTARYCLYAANAAGHIFRGPIMHAPWPLQPATARIDVCTLSDPLRIDLSSPPALVHYVRRLDVLAWGLEEVK